MDQSNVYTVLLHIGWEGGWEWTGLNAVLVEILTPPLPLPGGPAGRVRDRLERGNLQTCAFLTCLGPAWGLPGPGWDLSGAYSGRPAFQSFIKNVKVL